MTNKVANICKLEELVSLLDGNKSCRFVSVMYRAKESGEVALHNLLLNVKRENCLKVDLANLQKKLPTLEGIPAVACQELIDSITETLTTGSNSRYTKKDYYEKQGNGNVQVSVKAVCYVRGYVVKKTVVTPGTYKKVNSSPKTVAKNTLRKELKNTKCREYVITPENFLLARAEGKSIFVDATGSNLNHLANVPPVDIAAPVSV